MALLNEDQVKRALEVMRAYLESPKTSEGLTPVESSDKLDRERAAAIDDVLKPLMKEFLRDAIKLEEFKSKVDGFNRRNAHWGFTGAKGQMFFNMIVNVAGDLGECESELKAAIEVPDGDEVAARRIRTFVSYVKRVGERHVETGGEARSKPRPGSAPFFLSYFWQIEDREKWPMYYTASVNAMDDLNLWRPSDDPGADYVTYKATKEELARIFTRQSGRKFGFYEVEHVFWFYKGASFTSDRTSVKGVSSVEVETPVPGVHRLPESYVPPIVAILPAMARNEQPIRDAAKASGSSLERAFEKSIDAAFTILGYETTLLGQGQGRVPDGLALDTDSSYAILWDAKARGSHYGVGTDDRAMKEYIIGQSRELKRRKGFRNIYYFVVSSSFTDDYDDVVRSLKMETDVNEVLLVEAEALVAMVDAKLRAPREVTLGPDGLQRLFTTSGILRANDVREALA